MINHLKPNQQDIDCENHIFLFSHDKYPDGDWYKTYTCQKCGGLKDVLVRKNNKCVD